MQQFIEMYHPVDMAISTVIFNDRHRIEVKVEFPQDFGLQRLLGTSPDNHLDWPNVVRCVFDSQAKALLEGWSGGDLTLGSRTNCDFSVATTTFVFLCSFVMYCHMF